MKQITLLLLAFVIGMTTIYAQTNEELLKKGLKLKAEFKNKEALVVFQKLLKSDSSNVKHLHNGSYFYSKVGNTLETEDQRMEYYKVAEYLAKKALKTDNNSAGAHYAYAMALGRISENASSKEKIANAKVIKTEAEMAIKLNPKHAGAYHILGRWHRSIADFNFIEKAMINTFFGGVPEGGTFEDAVKSFKMAIIYDANYMLHKYELAVTFHEMDNDAKAIVWLKKALDMPATNEDDKKRRKMCEELLEDIE